MVFRLLYHSVIFALSEKAAIKPLSGTNGVLNRRFHELDNKTAWHNQYIHHHDDVSWMLLLFGNSAIKWSYETSLKDNTFPKEYYNFIIKIII